MQAFEHVGLFTEDDVPIPLVGVKATGTIIGRAAKMSLRQRFENREDTAIEAVYKFPLPENSSVCGFTVATGDRVLRGQVEEREEAFRIYDEALARGDGAYLLDEERPNIFTLSVGNVKARHAVDVEVEYVSLLETNADEVRFFLPSAISPRYVSHGLPDEGGIPTGALVNPEFRLDVPYGLQLHIDVLGRNDISGLECPSHSIRTTYSDDAIEVEFASDTTAMDRDFVLTVKHGKGFESTGFASTDDGRTYVQVDFAPQFGSADEGSRPQCEHPAAEVVFLLDCSGSMRGGSIEQAKNALELFLRGVPSGTLFNVYRFGSTYSKLFPNSVAYSPEHLEVALKHLGSVAADLGGTELFSPLGDIYGTATPKGFTRSIVLLTDGQVGNEAEILELVQGNSRIRLFTVGIGYGPNEYMVNRLAFLSGGAAESVAPGERIEPKVLRLFSRVTKGAVDDLQLDWGVVAAEQAPLKPVVYEGGCVSVLARLPREAAVPTQVRLKGRMNGVEKEWEVAISQADDAAVALPLLWARARLVDLEEGVAGMSGSRRVERKEKALESEIVAISRQYGLLSRETSFVVVESRVEPEKATGEMVLRKVPAMLTRGWGGWYAGEALAELGVCDMPARPCRGLRKDQVAFGLVANVPGFRRSSKALRPSLGLNDPLADILAMQTAEGGFMITGDRQASDIGLDLTELKEAAAQMDHGGAERIKLVSTAVILALLDKEFGGRQDEWLAVTEKSRKWFREQVRRLKLAVGARSLEEWAADYVIYHLTAHHYKN